MDLFLKCVLFLPLTSPLTSTFHVQEGEEVCINNGEQRSNDTLLQFYGFVERHTAHTLRSTPAISFLDPRIRSPKLWPSFCCRDNSNDTYTMDILKHLDVAKEEVLEVVLAFVSQVLAFVGQQLLRTLSFWVR